jgi:drug/metabolite transporter (DMT)-like permease
MPWLLVITQALISAGGVLFLRYAGQRFTSWSTLQNSVLVTGGIGTVLYGMSFLLWVYILSKTQASYAFPLTIGVSLLATTLGAVIIFSEKVSGLQIVGLVFLMIGVLLIGLFGKA